MARIKVEDLKQGSELSPKELAKVYGGGLTWLRTTATTIEPFRAPTVSVPSSLVGGRMESILQNPHGLVMQMSHGCC